MRRIVDLAASRPTIRPDLPPGEPAAQTPRVVGPWQLLAQGDSGGAALIGAVGYSMNHKHETWATMHRFSFLPMEYWAGIILFITACISYGQLKGAH